MPCAICSKEGWGEADIFSCKYWDWRHGGFMSLSGWGYICVCDVYHWSWRTLIDVIPINPRQLHFSLETDVTGLECCLKPTTWQQGPTIRGLPLTSGAWGHNPRNCHMWPMTWECKGYFARKHELLLLSEGVKRQLLLCSLLERTGTSRLFVGTLEYIVKISRLLVFQSSALLAKLSVLGIAVWHKCFYMGLPVQLLSYPICEKYQND